MSCSRRCAPVGMPVIAFPSHPVEHRRQRTHHIPARECVLSLDTYYFGGASC